MLDKPAKICGRLRRPIDQGKWFRPLHLNDWRPQAMKPAIESHLNYRGFLTRRMQRYWISWRSQPASVREIFLRFRNLDLSAVDRIMMDCYSSLGAAPRQPSCMLRSLLLMMITKCPSIPLWVMTLHTSPFYAVLSGFDPKDVPGVGTFYDFLDRLWEFQSKML